ncbi:hypothetical protein QYE76_070667 [Lolium multiflorum]|uniref:Uncharacterized protein n=1 Tax=Lolium multiflorum TaxID=4521 RepID=A0AAD8WG31_LOLMU|nr:hypothetical protein QYE76_070667 [Lolium multiflorum]
MIANPDVLSTGDDSSTTLRTPFLWSPRATATPATPAPTITTSSAASFCRVAVALTLVQTHQSSRSDQSTYFFSFKRKKQQKSGVTADDADGILESWVKLARQRIDLRHAQLPLKADIADKCQRLNEKKAALDAKTDTSVSTAELETLRKELEDLEERVRATKQLIQDKEALITRSQEEAEGLKAELKTDLAEIRADRQ